MIIVALIGYPQDDYLYPGFSTVFFLWEPSVVDLGLYSEPCDCYEQVLSTFILQLSAWSVFGTDPTLVIIEMLQKRAL